MRSFCPSQCPFKKIIGAARQRYGDSDEIARCEQALDVATI